MVPINVSSHHLQENHFANTKIDNVTVTNMHNATDLRKDISNSRTKTYIYFIVKLYAWKSVAHSLGHRWMCLLCLLLRPTKKERVLGFLRKKSYRELVGKPRVFIQQADLLWNCTDRANTVHNCEPLQITITSLFFYKDQTFTKNISLLLILKWWM